MTDSATTLPTIHLSDTLTGQKVPLEPLEPARWASTAADPRSTT